MLKHTPKVRKITYAIGFVSIGLGLITIIGILITLQIRKNKIAKRPSLTCNELIEQVITPSSFRTIIVEVKKTAKCDKEVTLESDLDGINTLCLCPGSLLPDSFFQPGDTLTLRPESAKLTITSAQNRNTINFDYPCCD